MKKNYFVISFFNLREDFILINGKVMKGRILGIIKRLILKYFPNSSDIVEPFIFAKLICSVGGVDRLIQLPSSTIQLIGAEKALFRHKSKKTNSPKYGLLYLSRKIQENSNKGKAARQISNKLFISIKLDYYQIIAQ
jgi:RNA processing factor Prp31